jgi:hypothetical protein
MKCSVLSRWCQVSFAVAFVLACVPAASADSITLSQVQVQVDPLALTASVSADLLAQSDTASPVFLDGLSVSLSENAVPLDLTAGPTTLDATPFFTNTPPFMLNGDTLGPVVLFRLLGLLPGGSYTGSFFLIEGTNPLEIAPQELSFTLPQGSPAPVPEPATVWLFGMGACSLWAARRRRLDGFRKGR